MSSYRILSSLGLLKVEHETWYVKTRNTSLLLNEVAAGFFPGVKADRVWSYWIDWKQKTQSPCLPHSQSALRFDTGNKHHLKLFHTEHNMLWVNFELAALNAVLPSWYDVRKRMLQTCTLQNNINSSVDGSKMTDMMTMVMEEWHMVRSGDWLQLQHHRRNTTPTHH